MKLLNRGVYCERCRKEIKYRDDLVTTTFLFQLVPYHDECYSKDIKGMRTFFVGNQPLNGLSGNIQTLIALILGIAAFFLLDENGRLTSLLAFVVLGYRLYSYFKFEKKLAP